jgi:peptidoglycan/LPS O-acetylase OafA/YrhL
MPADSRPRYVFIDALRGFAALAVVGFHAREGGHLAQLEPFLGALLNGVLRRGDAGVTVFFVISGFVIAASMAHAHVTPGYVGRFLARRSVRLDPAYWASLALTVGFGLLSVRFVPGKTYLLPTWGEVLVHLTYLTDLLGVRQLSAVYWTLCYEFQFYATFAVLLLGVTRLRERLGAERALTAVLWPATLLSDVWLVGLEPFHVHGLFVDRWHLFLTGVLVWRAVVRRGEGSGVHVAAAALQVTLVGVMGLVRADVQLHVAAATGALVLAVGLAGRLETWLSWRALQGLGAISYSLYLTHNTVTGALFRVGFRLTGRSPAWEAVWLVLATAACIGFAWVFHRLIEAPSLALSRRIRLGSSTEPATRGPAEAVPPASLAP